MRDINRRHFLQTSAATAAAASLMNNTANAETKPNVVWICVEDMSAHMSCYGETTIQTPNIDRLAGEGTRFSHAFVTCPVCSPSRSAMVTGMYQKSIGAHNHRSSRHDVKIRLPQHIRLVSEYFQEAGYYTSNGGMLEMDSTKKTKVGKTDYNFEYDNTIYDGVDWRGRKKGQPFFAQFQLRGGKYRNAKVDNPVDPNDVNLPPYYPDDPVLREDWAQYLNSVLHVDAEVSVILNALEDKGELENTIVFFYTDHGLSHVRDKQFMYDGGMHVPLIVRGPGVDAGKTNEHLTEHIDITATSLRMCGIDVPEHFQGRDLFDTSIKPREYVISARDRCDETVERMRAVRTKEYKYILNYYPELPHAQPNRYKDNKEIMKRMRELYAAGKLNAVQEKPFLPTRPNHELYDLKNDPYELNNLTEGKTHPYIGTKMLNFIMEWEKETGDIGRFPEPCIAEMLKEYDTPYEMMQDAKNRVLAEDMFTVWGTGHSGRSTVFIEGFLESTEPVLKYQALMQYSHIDVLPDKVRDILLSSLLDSSELIQLAAAWAASNHHEVEKARDVFVRLLLHSKNEVIRHYAAMGLENMGDDARPALDHIHYANKNDGYDYVKRVTARTAAKLDA